MSQITDATTLEAAVRKATADVTITDVHTHIFPPAHGEILLWGADELINYHYLVAELFTVAPAELTYKKFWSLTKPQRSEIIWDELFIKRGPLSEATRGVLTCFNRLGLDVAGRDLPSIRKWFAAQKVEDYIEKVFELAGLDYAIMTNDPFVPAEVEAWKSGVGTIDRMKPALRIDTLILNFAAAAKTMAADGYKTSSDGSGESYAEAKRFLIDWAERIKPLYLAASLPNDFAYPSDDESCKIIREVVIPAAKELSLPLAMMIGVRKGVNPNLGDGGDGVGVADVGAVQALCQEYQDVKFLVTMLSRVNQHELCVLARKFGNLHLFGCWWFNNNPSIIEELTRMRLELLGTAVTCQHSDARVLDQLIYKWTHTRKIVADVLVDKYADQFAAGWRVTTDEIGRDVRAIFGGSFEQFLAK